MLWCTLLLLTVVSCTLAQTCNPTTNAAAFGVGTFNRWLYDNLAPGAECIRGPDFSEASGK